jgi:HK97 family phage major capsid protein
MWIRFTRTIEGTAVKENTFADVEEAIAKNYVALAVAENAPEDPATRAAAIVMAQMAPLVAAQGQHARTAAAAATAAVVRPATVTGGTAAADHAAGRGLDIGDGRITPGMAQRDKTRGPGDYIRNVINALGCPDVEVKQRAHTSLIQPFDEGGYGCRRTMTEGGGVSAGYSTPVVYEQQFQQYAAEQQVILPYCEEKPLAAREVWWPALDQYAAPAAGQSSMFGGVQVYRKGETQHRTSTALALRKIGMNAQDLTAYATLSRDLVQDSEIAIDGYVVQQIGGAIGWREDWESINGTGVGQLLGFQNSPAYLFVTRHTSGSIVYQDIFTMKTRLFGQASMPAWITHPYSVYDIETLVDPSGRFIFVPNAYVSGGAPVGGVTVKMAGTLLGYPLITTEKVPVLGTAGDLSLIDRKSYWFGRRGGVEIGLSEHFLFDQDELAIRCKSRNDGKPGMIQPIYLADGTQANQVSAFVGLQ